MALGTTSADLDSRSIPAESLPMPLLLRAAGFFVLFLTARSAARSRRERRPQCDEETAGSHRWERDGLSISRRVLQGGMATNESGHGERAGERPKKVTAGGSCSVAAEAVCASSAEGFQAQRDLTARREGVLAERRFRRNDGLDSARSRAPITQSGKSSMSPPSRTLAMESRCPRGSPRVLQRAGSQNGAGPTSSEGI